MTMVSTTLTSDTVVIICTFSTEISAAATRLSSSWDSLLSSTRQIAFLWGSELSWNYPFLSVLLADAACVLRRSSHSHIYWTFTRDPTYWHWLTAKLATFKVFLHPRPQTSLTQNKVNPQTCGIIQMLYETKQIETMTFSKSVIALFSKKEPKTSK